MRSKNNSVPDKVFEQLIPITCKSARIHINDKISDEELEFGVVHAILCFQLCRKPICKN